MRQVLCFGDSNTWGLIPGTWDRYPWGTRWTSLVQEDLAAQDVRIIEDGLCGRTSVFDDALRPFRNSSKTLPLSLEVNGKLDAIVLMLGTNDCKTYFGANATVIGRGVERLIQQIQKTLPSIPILLVSPIHLGEEVWRGEFDPEFDVNSIQKSKELSTVYAALARKYGLRFLAASDYASPSKTDMEHLTAEGHRALATAIGNDLSELLAS